MPDRNPLYDFGDEGEGEAPTFNEKWGNLPVEAPRFNLTPNVALVESTPKPLKQGTDPVTGRPDLKFVPVDDPWANTPKPIKRLLGVGGEERYQLWPERALRSGLSAPLDALTGKMQVNDPETGMPTDEAIRRSQDVASVGGPGGMMNLEPGPIVGSGFIRPGVIKPEAFERALPALKNNQTGKITTVKRGEGHLEAAYDLWQKNGGDKDASESTILDNVLDKNSSGFYDPKTKQFFDRTHPEWANIDSTDLLPKKSMRSNEVWSDTSKPGMAMAAIRNSPPFYSAVEHAVSNIKQDKMPADQWLGTLTNSKGVKPEELDWTGLKDHLSSKGKEPVTKQEVQDYVNANKVELKEVNKGARPHYQNFTDEDVLNRAKEWSHSWYQKPFEELNERERTNILNDSRSSLEVDNFSGKEVPTETKYSQYQLSGGEPGSYKEMLMTLPAKNNKISDETIARNAKDKFGVEWKELSEADKNNLRNLANGYAYRSSHWDEPNVLAHVRTNDRNITAPGETTPKKSLHIEEIQSDWHQAGRDKGYKPSVEEYRNKKEEYNQQLHDITKQLVKEPDKEKQLELYKKQAEITYKRNALHDSFDAGIPDAPFKKTWHELALKRMIREAAEKGYDRLSWTPGEAQAARYSLEKQVEQISFNPSSGMLKAYKKGGNGEKVIDEKIKPNELASYIGKEAADKLINSPTRTFDQVDGKYHILEGEGLKVGGEGMKGFYDKMIPNAIEKIGKEHGVKVKQGKTEGTYDEHKVNKDNYDPPYRLENKNSSGIISRHNTAQEAWDKAEELTQRPVHYIDIPESLKNQALGKGFPLFSSGGHFLNPIPGNPHEQVDNSHHVPYGAGASNTPTGFPVNIDKRIPKYDDKLKLPNGQPADLHKYLTIHEIEEYKAMKAGIPYHKAHHDIATPMEKKAVESDGVSWKEYEHIMDGYLKETEEGGYKNLPPRLYTKPYPHSRSLKMDHGEDNGKDN